MPSSQILLGWTHSTEGGSPSPVYHHGDGHLITVAPTGAGKGVSAAIPALLTWSGPAIVIDPKGEAFNVTARYRRDLGQDVRVLDPFGVVTETSDCLNPMQLLDNDSPNLNDDAFMLANLLANGLRNLRDPFWDERATTLLTGLILSSQLSPHKILRTLHYVRDDLFDLIAGHGNGLQKSYESTRNSEILAAYNVTRSEPRVVASIYATASAHIGLLRSGPIATATNTDTISLKTIADGDPLTVYIVLPPDKLASHGRLLRLWLGVILTTLGRRKVIPKQATLLIVDEAAQLGHLPALETAVTLLRGYGVKLWSFWQDLSQLESCYPLSWPTLLNNSITQQFFAPASPFAAAALDTYLAGSNSTPAGKLTENDVLVSQLGKGVRLLTRASYLTDDYFRGRFEANPFFANRTKPALTTDAKQALGSNVVSLDVGRKNLGR